MIKELSYHQRKIVYEVHGTGSPLILLHGFGEKRTIWNNQVEYLKDHYKVIVPDLPGSGDSELTEDMTMEGLAETIHSIIHQEDIDRAIVIGHSMGGYITLALAEKYWNHLDGYGLFHSTAYADSDEKKAARRKGIAFIRANGADRFLGTITPDLFSEKTRKENPELVEEHIKGLKNFTPSALISYYESMIRRPDRTETLKRSSVPVLFIIGEMDNIIPMNDMLLQAQFPERSASTILRASGHLGMLEEPEKTNKSIQDFFAFVLG